MRSTAPDVFSDRGAKGVIFDPFCSTIRSPPITSVRYIPFDGFPVAGREHTPSRPLRNHSRPAQPAIANAGRAESGGPGDGRLIQGGVVVVLVSDAGDRLAARRDVDTHSVNCLPG